MRNFKSRNLIKISENLYFLFLLGNVSGSLIPSQLQSERNRTGYKRINTVGIHSAQKQRSIYQIENIISKCKVAWVRLFFYLFIFFLVLNEEASIVELHDTTDLKYFLQPHIVNILSLPFPIKQQNGRVGN